MRITIKDISFDYGLNEVLKDLSFNIESKEVTSIIGISGSGKSTILKLIAGLHEPKFGSINFNGQKKTASTRFENISYIFQNSTLLPWKTVLQNIEISKVENTPLNSNEICKLIGLEDFMHFYPSQLSGGMKQRVEFGRILGRQSKILLMDEPFSNLDVHYRKYLKDLFREIQALKGTTTILVSHNIDEVLSVSRFIKILLGRPVNKILEFDLLGLINKEKIKEDITNILLEEFKKYRKI